MKAKHRHDLETNELARRLAAGIEKSRPYGPTILGVLVAIVVCMMLLSYLNSASAERQSEAWSQYYAAMQMPAYSYDQSMQMLKLSAEEYPGTPIQRWADITWADGQLWVASAAYLQNRDAATEAMNRAANAYKSLVKTASDDWIVDRANFGLGRIYEMQGDLERAKEHYDLVRGGFAELAKQRVEQIDNPDTREELAQSLSWLSTAQLAQRQAPSGPGTPGRQPLFSPGELEMPASRPSGAETSGATSGRSGETATGSDVLLDDLFKGFNSDKQPEGTDRYEAGEPAPTDETPTNGSNTGDSSNSEP